MPCNFCLEIVTLFRLIAYLQEILKVWLIHWFTIHWFIDWLIDWLIDYCARVRITADDGHYSGCSYCATRFHGWQQDWFAAHCLTVFTASPVRNSSSHCWSLQASRKRNAAVDYGNRTKASGEKNSSRGIWSRKCGSSPVMGSKLYSSGAIKLIQVNITFYPQSDIKDEVIWVVSRSQARVWLRETIIMVWYNGIKE